METHPKNILAAKQMARDLRDQLKERGEELSHSEALERVANTFGHKDWNTLHASFAHQPPIVWALGGLVEGQYLSQDIVAEIKNIVPLKPGWFRLSIVLDEAVDVVTFDSFSNFRKQILADIGPLGESEAKTSNGLPQMSIKPI